MFEAVVDRLPSNVIPFAETPGGDLICFDYSNDDTNPIVVYWDHELGFEDTEKSTCFVATTFEAFIESLYEMDEN